MMGDEGAERSTGKFSAVLCRSLAVRAAKEEGALGERFAFAREKKYLTTPFKNAPKIEQERSKIGSQTPLRSRYF